MRKRIASTFKLTRNHAYTAYGRKQAACPKWTPCATADATCRCLLMHTCVHVYVCMYVCSSTSVHMHTCASKLRDQRCMLLFDAQDVKLQLVSNILDGVKVKRLCWNPDSSGCGCVDSIPLTPSHLGCVCLKNPFHLWSCLGK